MEKIIKIGEYELPVKSTAASLFSYKANFSRDGIKDLIKLSKAMPGSETTDIKDINTDELDLDVFFRFLWVFAKAADKEIKPLEEWLESFDLLPMNFVMEALPQVMDLLMSTVKSSVKSKN